VPQAEYQAELLRKLRQQSDDYNNNNGQLFGKLTAIEQQVLSRGRNSVSKSRSNRNRINPGIYQDATAMEALVGYLYLVDPTRCATLLQWIGRSIDEQDNNNNKTTRESRS
jgi:23S rRNA maturation mini-RNase III